MSNSTLVYSSFSSVAPVGPSKAEVDAYYAAELAELLSEPYTYEEYVNEAHCFVCGRTTDHFAEHDDLVDQGFATYEQNGSVILTDAGWVWKSSL